MYCRVAVRIIVWVDQLGVRSAGGGVEVDRQVLVCVRPVGVWVLQCRVGVRH